MHRDRATHDEDLAAVRAQYSRSSCSLVSWHFASFSRNSLLACSFAQWCRCAMHDAAARARYSVKHSRQMCDDLLVQNDHLRLQLEQMRELLTRRSQRVSALESMVESNIAVEAASSAVAGAGTAGIDMRIPFDARFQPGGVAELPPAVPPSPFWGDDDAFESSVREQQLYNTPVASNGRW